VNLKAYIDIIKKILNDGEKKEDRTGTGTIAIAGAMFEHDMANGFPLLTTKTVPFRLVASELEFFIKGITDKKWLIERNNHIWDEWCSPDKVPYSHDDETKRKMMEERELGPIYGFQWRHFNAEYASHDKPPKTEGVDQLKNVVNKLKQDPNDRRMIVMAWNPSRLQHMALPPCHYGFQIYINNGKLDLLWNQRSADVFLGLPYDIAMYGLLLLMLAKGSGYKPGRLTASLGDCHLYNNHIEQARKQLSRDFRELPNVEIDYGLRIEQGAGNFIMIPTHNMIHLKNYNPHESIKAKLNVGI
jgi:thymidylate synthase